MRIDFTGLPRLWDVKGWLKAILSHEPHPLLQFIRYGIAGVAAMAANILVFWICLNGLFAVPESVAPVGPPYSDSLNGVSDWYQQMREDPNVAAYVKSNTIAFLIANIVAYVLNFKWVFQGGRHARSIEIVLFFFVSLVAFLLGTAMAGTMVGTFGINEYVAKISDVIFAILINFICRKFLVFKQ